MVDKWSVPIDGVRHTARRYQMVLIRDTHGIARTNIKNESRTLAYSLSMGHPNPIEALGIENIRMENEEEKKKKKEK